MKLRLLLGDENRFLAQFSTEERDSRTDLLLAVPSDVNSLRSVIRIKNNIRN